MLLPPWAGLEGGHATSPHSRTSPQAGGQGRGNASGLPPKATRTWPRQGGWRNCPLSLPPGASHGRAGVPFGPPSGAPPSTENQPQLATRGLKEGASQWLWPPLSLKRKMGQLFSVHCGTEGSSPDPTGPPPPPSQRRQPPTKRSRPALPPNTPPRAPPSGAARETPPDSDWQLPPAEATLRGLLPHQATPPTHLEVKAQGTWGNLWSGRARALGRVGGPPDWDGEEGR